MPCLWWGQIEAVGWATSDCWGRTGCFQQPKGIGAGLGLSEEEAKIDGQVINPTNDNLQSHNPTYGYQYISEYLGRRGVEKV